jgi:uncharacterized membrane protein
MATAPQPSKAAVLNSWKEIAAYLGRGVRTVQRYEHDLRLPVRRPRGTPRSAVIALTTDLDEWLRNTPASALSSGSAKEALPHVVSALHESVRDRKELWQVCHELRSANQAALSTLVDSIRKTRELVRVIRQAREELALVRDQGGGTAAAFVRTSTRPN